jgi:DNA (cytosine-5)-methyltransferase 1
MKPINQLSKISAFYNKIANELYNAGLKYISEAHISHYFHNPTQPIPGLSKKEKILFQKTISPFLPYNNESNKDSTFFVATEQMSLLFDDIPYPQPRDSKFTFIDLFAGIGGFRIAMQSIGGKCLFSSEWDKYAQLTYLRNYGEIPFGDIRNISASDIPDHDILCAGFPCQPFSLAGVSKKNSLGRKHGFEDETQGTLFFDIARIIKEKRPKAFFLENVKNLLVHDKGRTFEIIRRTLDEELGYEINFEIVDGAAWVPQHRERLYIVGFSRTKTNVTKNKIIIPLKPDAKYIKPELRDIIKKNVDPKYTLGQGTWATLERHKEYHQKMGNGFGYGLHKLPIKPGEITRTISARYHKDGAEILIEQKGKRPRKLTIQEAMQLQGYDPKRFIFPVSDTQAYHQIGNSVVVPAIRDVAKMIIENLTQGT